jgi:hypothetical protein
VLWSQPNELCPEDSLLLCLPSIAEYSLDAGTGSDRSPVFGYGILALDQLTWPQVRATIPKYVKLHDTMLGVAHLLFTPFERRL